MFKVPLAEELVWSPEIYQRGEIVRCDIKDGKVTGKSTLFSGIGEYPAISLDGGKVAFFEWGLQVQNNHVVAGTENAPCFLTVVNADGTNLRRLIQVEKPATWDICAIYEAREGNSLLDWTSGGWIYYEKPTKTAEIWRINVNDPSRNERVITYVKCGSCEPDCPKPYFRRWDLSVDAAWAACQVKKACVTENAGHAFPPPNGRICDAFAQAYMPGCNLAISPSGSYLVYYLYEGHSNAFLCQWDHRSGAITQNEAPTISSPGFGEVASWAGVASVGANAERLRWSANSDKWYCRSIAWDANSNNYYGGSNQVLVDWKEQYAIVSTNNAAGSGINNCTGDFWIAGGQANSYETIDGTWHFVAPVDPVGTAAIPVFSRPADKRGVIAHCVAPGRLAVTVHETSPGRIDVIDIRGRTADSRLYSSTGTQLMHSAPGSSVMIIKRNGSWSCRRIVVE